MLTAVPCIRSASLHSAYDSHVHGMPVVNASTGMSSMKPNTSDARVRSAARTGVSESEQFPVTTVVTPCWGIGSSERVPPHRRVVVRVAVDEAGRDDRATGVDLRLAVGLEVRSHLDDDPVADAHVGSRGLGGGGAVDERAAAYQQVSGHGRILEPIAPGLAGHGDR